MREFERAASAIGARIDQVPYALSLALNDAAREVRQKIISETWPKSVTVRNKTFMRAALQIEWAKKNALRVTVFDRLHRASLAQHASGGVKIPKSGRIAVPSKNIVLTSKGVPSRQRPRNLSRKVVKKGLIFQATGKGKTSKLRLMFKLTPSVQIRKDVPFYEDFARLMAVEMRSRFPAAIAKAMRTAR